MLQLNDLFDIEIAYLIGMQSHMRRLFVGNLLNILLRNLRQAFGDVGDSSYDGHIRSLTGIGSIH